MRTICVVTSTRADYGILRPLMQRLANHSELSLSVVATGMHLCRDFGNTYLEIEQDGFRIDKKIDIQLQSDTHTGMSKAMGLALIGFADYFQDNAPDLLVVLGDRFEILAVCCAALNQQIPIAHIHGGEQTQGAIDDVYRHAITKMSSMHFVSTQPYRNRVVQLGERPDTVFNVGAMGVENIMRMKLPELSALSEWLSFPLTAKQYAVVTFHPVTTEKHTGADQVRQLMGALERRPELSYIITKSNSDAGGREINALWDDYAQNHKNCVVVASLGAQRYLAALKYSRMMIGNSSSGIIEGPASKIPTINIGNRQLGRIMAESVISCEPVTEDILKAMDIASTENFQRKAMQATNPYGDGTASQRIVQEIMHAFNSNLFDTKKVFYDMEQTSEI